MNLVERDAAVIWHPFTPQKNRIAPIPITKGKGTLLYDADGNTYIDAISSWWVTLHGHAHPYIAEKLYQQALQLEQVIFAGFTHEPAVRLAEQLLEILPGPFTKIFYSDNGSTSTEVALKMAIQFWWNQQQQHRKKIIALKNAYHGDTFGAMSVSDRSIFTLAFHDLLFEVIFLDTPTPENITTSIATIQQHAREVAAFIYEPLVQGAGGLKMYDAGLLNQLLTAAKSHDLICIADEVMTGFYRTGKIFASAYLNVPPDIICLSKGLTGGTMALGITACTSQIYDAYVQDDALKTFFHGHSFTANPLACTAALASLDLLQQYHTVKSIETIGAAIQNFALELAQLKVPIKNIRVLGTLLAFEITSGKDEYLNDISRFVTQTALQQGVYLRPLGNTMYIMPPYCISNEELNCVFSVIKNILQHYE
ncbi:adenosylmethionine--8-amino-7-oxononanoate transaminase [Hydrotalea sp.]|uniref:adenosylmethionine--8-amino-7-oxononanoate transaminase n=2 Tax=Hydrotalea sp. TaxID=2881279 RepID=UPI00262BCDB2|nr:adenosylmethionine--8-amino-7-oxononanoate transaminase [Hydrotalea sp.]